MAATCADSGGLIVLLHQWREFGICLFYEREQLLGRVFPSELGILVDI